MNVADHAELAARFDELEDTSTELLTRLQAVEARADVLERRLLAVVTELADVRGVDRGAMRRLRDEAAPLMVSLSERPTERLPKPTL